MARLPARLCHRIVLHLATKGRKCKRATSASAPGCVRRAISEPWRLLFVVMTEDRRHRKQGEASATNLRRRGISGSSRHFYIDRTRRLIDFARTATRHCGAEESCLCSSAVRPSTQRRAKQRARLPARPCQDRVPHSDTKGQKCKRDPSASATGCVGSSSGEPMGAMSE